MSHTLPTGSEESDPPSRQASLAASPNYIVTLGGQWRLFSAPVAGYHMMGTVQIGMEFGALAKSSEGRWVHILEGVATPLPQERIADAVQAARAGVRHPIR